jgi:hypothetical protein
MSSSRNAAAVPAVARGSHPEDPVAAHHIDRGELPPFDAWHRMDMHRVELDQLSGSGGRAFVLGHAGGMGTDGARSSHPHRSGLDQQASAMQTGEDPANRRGGERHALPLQQDPDAEDRLFLGGGPLPLLRRLGTTGPGLQRPQVVGVVPAQPAVDRGARAMEDPHRRRDAMGTGMLDAAQPELRRGVQRDRGRQGAHPHRIPGPDAQATAQSALLHPASTALAMLGHEGILLRLG